MRAGRYVFLFALAALSLFAADAARADVYGRIRGTVTDPSGAVVPKAKIVALNAATEMSTAVASSSDGTYEFLQLAAPADYTISVEAPGFKKFEATSLHLSLNQIFVLNIRLDIGTVVESVVVSEAAVAQVETTSIQLGRVLSADSIVNLPLIGRQWINLQQTLPGVVASDRFSLNFSTNGSRSQTNDFLINGTDANDSSINTPMFTSVSPDAIAEVSLITNTINPEYGRAGGAVLNATTKSGTNNFHGDGFDFYRDTALNTRNFFSKTKTVFHMNQFGATIGGPIRKDKAFFFFSYYGERERRPESPGDVIPPVTPGTALVFTDAQRGGDFSTSGAFTCSSAMTPCTSPGVTGCPKGASWNSCFPNGMIPTTDLNPLSVNLMNMFVPHAANGLFEFNPVVKISFNQYLGQVDYNLTTKDRLTGYFFNEPEQAGQDLSFVGADLPGFAEKDPEHFQQYTAKWTHTFSGSMTNEVRVGYNRNNFDAVEPVTPVLPSSVGFTGINPQFPAVAGVPHITIGGFFQLGFSSNGPQPRIVQTYSLGDDLSKIVGRHTLKFGFSMRRSQVFNPFLSDNSGNFTFNGAGAFSTGNPGADFLLGVPDSYLQENGGIIDSRTREYYVYWQDEWKIRPNLTFTYGLGWQIDTPLTEKYLGGEAMNCFVPGEQSKVFPTAPAGLVFPGDPGCNSAGGAVTRWRHVAPRLGFAWAPGSSRKLSIRGGFGVYYDKTEGEPLLQTLTPAPFSLISAGAADTGGSPSFAAPYTDISTGTVNNNPFPFAPPKPGSSFDFTTLPPLSLVVFDRNLSVPYTMNYNLTVERVLPGSMVLSVGYVGLQGRKLTNAVELNPAGSESGNPVCAADPNCNSFSLFSNPTGISTFRFPQTFIPHGGTSPLLRFGAIDQYATFVNSHYNAFQATLDKKPTHGLSLRATYSYSHSLDGSSSFEDLGFSGIRGFDPFNPKANFGDSAFDARQRFVVSYTYDFPSTHKLGGASRLLDGWRTGSVITFQTGIPVTVGDIGLGSDTCDIAFEFFSCWDRPNVVAPVKILDPRTSVLKGVSHYWFDPSAFAAAPAGVIGNAGRNFFHGPGINNFDFDLMKDTKITESTRVELRLEISNLWNHAQFSINGVHSAFGTGSFGRITSARTPNDSRIVQLAGKFYF